MTATMKLSKKVKYIILTLLSLGVLLIGCQSQLQQTANDIVPIEEILPEQITNTNNETETNNIDSDIGNDSATSNSLDISQLQELKVNELGEVMVLMYHIIGDKEDEWERTKDNFRNDLKTLYDDGYYLVTARDFVTGNMDVPTGKTPVILTFDDSTEGHFRFIEKENGELIADPDSAVGIIENFAKEHPDFGQAASFYVFYPVPFRQNDHPEWRQLKYEYLTNLGMEIGNHTFGHDFLNKLNDEEVQQTLVKNIQATQALLPNYSVDTFALTYGIYPKNKDFAASGVHNGFQYNHKGVFLVGSNPSPSPFSIDFNSIGIPRIRAASVPEDYFNQWIEYFRNHPERRYISDGDNTTITVPNDLENLINNDSLGDKKIRLY